ncbi:MAG: DUF2878 domain-containing protein, partial [Halobacteriovoraceae bacterium]|nr:DUF2878 domain-containing protein [Halobacteriovoraceae bacterium]
MTTEKGKRIIGFLFSALSWWVCVLGGKFLTPYQQLAFFPLFIVFSFILHYSVYVEFPKPFTLFYILCIILGLTADGLLLTFELFSYKGPRLFQFPFWLFTLWLIFPFNFLHSFRKFTEKPVMGILFGIIGGPLAYSAGPKLEILNLAPYALIYVGVFWGLFMAFVYWINR